MIFLTFLTFAAYHEGTGSVVWLQWLSVLAIMAFLLIFDLGFTNEHSFIFDPDAENWRRKVVRFEKGSRVNQRLLDAVSCLIIILYPDEETKRFFFLFVHNFRFISNEFFAGGTGKLSLEKHHLKRI